MSTQECERHQQYLPATDEGLAIAGKKLRDGLLVSFPTETVYGLGADALQDEAAKRIFAVKGRPATDPLIVHVTQFAEAARLWELTPTQSIIVEKLTAKLWPGPFTVVAKAASCVPLSVTGGSGTVGIRVPDHPVALALIRAAGVPIAAPSANYFGHVSPTTAQHVYEDLAARDPSLSILDGGVCRVGIESTVTKLVGEKHIEILRKGYVSKARIEALLLECGLADVTVTVRDTRTKYLRGDMPMDGPGQLLTHYAPTVPSFLLGPKDVCVSDREEWSLHAGGAYFASHSVIVLDYAATLHALSAGALAYRSLGDGSDAKAASAAVFDALRWCETIEGASAVVFPKLAEFWKAAPSHKCEEQAESDFLDAIDDRLFRAASGSVGSVVCVRKEAENPPK